MAQLKIDECLSHEIAAIFARHGHDAVTVLQQGMKGYSDDRVWAVVQRERRWLVTMDLRFSDIRTYAPGTHHGIVLMRMSNGSRLDYERLARTVAREIDLDTLPGALIVATPRAVRIRRQP